MLKAIVTMLCFFMWVCFSPLVSSLDMLKSGEKLNSSSILVSAQNTFTLGFYTPKDSRNSYLGIWYNQRTEFEEIPVWIANRNRPIYNYSGILTISGAGEVIIEHNGGDPIELFKAENGTNVTATFLDSGNFVVREMSSNGSSSSGKVLWQSFDYPTDTLLPGMKLGFNQLSRRDWALTSWLSENNPSSGAFSLEWDSIKGRLIVKRRGVGYWSSGYLKFYYEIGDVKLYSFENIIYKPDLAKPSYIFKNFSSQDEVYFSYSLFENHIFVPGNRKINSRWRLNYQGEIDDNDLYRIAEIDRCYGYNTNYTTDNGVDSGGCELWNQPKCRNSHQKFSRQRDTSLYFYDFFHEASSNLSLSDCRANCWNDCKCVAFLHEVNGCSYWRGKNVSYEQGYNQLSSLRYVLVSEPSKKRWKKWMIIIPVAIALVLVFLGNSLFILRKFKQGKRKKKELQELMMLEGYTETTEFENDGGRGHDLKMFTYASIMASTNNFSLDNKLGEGGFGPVYKGKMPEGHEIAIKLLSQRSKQGLLEFKTELILISKLQHRNLVKLLGFCIHGNEKMIIYDYMPNKSLDFFLFDPVKREELNWETRFNIIEGIAQGLLYLHKHSRLLIVHRDLKAGNILLDENMNAKISDFGLARIFKRNVPEVNTSKRVGTYGYMAPEYAMQGIFSVKSDIYSFGVLILEIVSGRRNNSFQNLEGPLTLVEFAWELWKQHAELELVDPLLNSADMKDLLQRYIHMKDQMQRCIHVGLLCVQHHAIDRPPIEDVMSMLKNETTALSMPKEPAFVVRDNVVQKSQKLKSEKFSGNQVSVSAVDGR